MRASRLEITSRRHPTRHLSPNQSTNMTTQIPQMTAVVQPVAPPQRAPVLLFTIMVAVLITNLFGPQTLVGLMASAFGLSTAASGTMAMISTIGYSVGLFFIVPLADLVENRRLITYMLTCASL